MAGFEVHRGKLRVYFQYQDEKCRETFGPDTPENRDRALGTEKLDRRPRRPQQHPDDPAALRQVDPRRRPGHPQGSREAARAIAEPPPWSPWVQNLHSPYRIQLI